MTTLELTQTTDSRHTLNVNIISANEIELQITVLMEATPCKVQAIPTTRPGVWEIETHDYNTGERAHFYLLGQDNALSNETAHAKMNVLYWCYKNRGLAVMWNVAKLGQYRLMTDAEYQRTVAIFG